MTDKEDLVHALPYARRYARALTGSQEAGDSLVGIALSRIVSGEGGRGLEARAAVYAGVSDAFAENGGEASGHLTLSVRQRQLLLLTSLEELSPDLAADILGISRAEAENALAEARGHLRASSSADVLIIEDEPIIAMDLEELVRACGHRVVGTACSEQEAVEIAARTKPGLILADINLGVGGDGKNAVGRIMRNHYAPVIFVTAYPERLLTGEAVEPAFIITKPFEPTTLAIATYQAVTGGVQLA